MNDKYLFESDRIYYINLSTSLVNDYLNLVNDYDVAKFVMHNPVKMDYEKEYNWVLKKLNNKDIIFSMIEKESNEFIGNIEIKDISGNKGVLGISLISSKQNKHYGSESIRRIMEYAFNDLGLECLELVVYSNNNKAICCYKNIGFEEFKREFNTGVCDNEPIDDIYMRIKK